MRNPKKRCSICGRWYRPDKRTRQHQTCCSKASCKKKRKARANKSWRTRHHGYDESRRLKKRDWAQKNDDYWRRYRQEHPEYRARDNRRRQASRDRVKRAANQDTIREKAVEKLRSIPLCEPEYAANQDVMDRRVDELVSYLLWKERAARQNGMVCLGRDKP